MEEKNTIAGKKWFPYGRYSNIYVNPVSWGTFKKLSGALAGVAQWLECWPANQKVAGPIPLCLPSFPHL